MIEVVNLHKSFGRLEVLKGVDLEIEKGKITAIIGKSGQGKTVLIKHIVGLLKPDSGHVFVDGVDITKLNMDELNKVRRRFGMLFQEAALFDSMTAVENVAFPIREHTNLSEKEIKELARKKLEMVKLFDVEDKMPHELSGGMKKRVGLARAIALDPEIIIYDEPTIGLDPPTGNAIYDLILDMQKQLKVTSIIITHDVPAIFSVADKVAVLSDGKIIEYGTPDDIMKSERKEIKEFLLKRQES